MEDVLFIAVERSHEIVTQEVTPADGTLSPQAVHALIQIVSVVKLFLLLSLLMFKFGLVEGRDNFRHGKWDG